MCIKDLVDDQGEWNRNMLESLFPHNIVQRIVTILPPNLEAGNDRRLWPGNKLGQFSVSSAYKQINYFHNLETTGIWKLAVPQRILVFVWQVAHGRLKTKVGL